MNEQVDPDTLEKLSPALGISLSVQFGQDRGATFQTHIPLDCALPDINKALDKIMQVADRQRAIAALPDAHKKLERLEKMYVRINEDLVRLDSTNHLLVAENRRIHETAGKRGEPTKMAPSIHAQNEKNNAERANALITKDRLKEDIQIAKDEIAELEKLVGE